MDKFSNVRDCFLHWFYMRGYMGQSLPIWLRRMFPGTQIHRAWLSGRYGNFWERDVRFGPTNPYGQCTDGGVL